MHLNFATLELEALCNSSAQLDRKFGKSAQIVRLRLLCLWNAPKLRAVTVKPPDRRMLEPGHGQRAMSVCVRDAGRIYFHAGSHGSRIVGPIEDVDVIEIFAIGKGNP